MIVSVTPEQAAALDEIAAAASPGQVLLLADGIYDRSNEPPIELTAPGIQLRSASGNPSAVVLDGEYDPDWAHQAGVSLRVRF